MVQMRKAKPRPPARAPLRRSSEIPITVQAAAFELYLQRRGLDSIASELKCAFHGLKSLSESEDWPAKRIAIEAVLKVKYERELIHRLAMERGKIVDRHCSLTELLDGHLLKHLSTNRKVSVTRLEAIAKSLNYSAGVAARAVGLDKVVTGSTKLVQPGIRGRRPQQIEATEQKKGTEDSRLSPIPFPTQVTPESSRSPEAAAWPP